MILKAADIEICERKVKLNKPDPETFTYPFGKQFTDHMFTVDWDLEQGWMRPKIQPYGPFLIPTSTTSLHYGISAYEGFSVFRNVRTERPQAFRAQENL